MSLPERTRFVLASAASAAVVLAKALPDLPRMQSLAGANPAAHAAIVRDSCAIWSIILGASLFAAISLSLLSRLTVATKGAIVAGLLMPLVVILSTLPVYWYSYRGIPAGWHVSISAVHRYTAPVAGLAGFLAYALAGLGRETAGRERPSPFTRHDPTR